MDKAGFRILQATVESLAREVDLATGLESTLKIIGEGLDLEVGQFWRFAAESGCFELDDKVWNRGPVPAGFFEAERRNVIRAGDEFPGQVAITRKPLVTNDIDTCPKCLRSAAFRSADLTSLIALPVFAADEPVGVLEFLGKSAFTMPDTGLTCFLETLAGVIGEFARRTRAERAAKAKEKLLLNILDEIPVGLFFKNRHGVYQLVNRAILEENAMQADQIVGHSDSEIFPPNVAEESVRTDRHVLETGSMSERVTFIDSPSHPRHALIRKARLHGHEDLGFEICGVVQNVTTQKMAEEALRLSERRLNLAMLSAHEAVWEWNVRTGEVLANDLWLRQLGYEPGEVKPNKELWTRAVHPADDATVRAASGLILSGESDTPFEYRIVKPSGEIRWIRTSGIVIEQAEDGSPAIVIGSNLDITDRKRAEESLHRSERRFRHALEAAQESVWEVNLLTQEVEVSDLWYRQLGYEPGEVPARFDLWFQAVHPEDLPSLIATHEAFVQGGNVNTIEHRIVTKTGEIRWIRVSVMITERDAAGQPIWLLGTNLDITDRKRAEESLQRSESRLRNALEAAQESVWEWDIRSGTITANDLWFRQLGFEPGEVPPHVDIWRDQIHPDDRAATLAARDAMLGGTSEVTTEFRIRTLSGETRWIRSCSRIVERGAEGEPVRVVGSNLDITDRKRAEESLQRSESRFRNALEAAQEAVWEWNIATGEITGNDLWFRQLGYEPGEIPGSLDSWVMTLHPDDRDETLRLMGDYIEGRSPINWSEHRIVTKTGEVRWTRTTGSIVEWSPEGMPLRVVGTNLDITDRKRAEESLQRSEARLRYALEAAQEAVWEWDVAAGEVIVNDLWYRQLGFEPGEIPVSTATWDSMAHPGDRYELSRLRESFLHGQGKNGAEHRIVTKSGEVRWVRSRGIVVETDASGLPRLIVGTTLDITDQRLAEQALQQRGSFLRAVLESAGEAIIVGSENGTITLFNPAAERLLGYSAKEIVGLKTPEAFHDPEEVERRAISLSEELGREIEPSFEVFVAKSRNDEPETREWTYIHKNGQRVPVLLTVSSLKEPGGEITGFLGIARDISEPKKAEAALRESELKLSLALQLAKAGPWAYDVATDRFTFGDRFYSIFRTDSVAMGGDTMSSADYASRFLLKEDQPLVGDEIRKALLSTEPRYDSVLEHRFLYADGELGQMAVRFMARKDESGNTVQMIGVNQDITDRKRAEQALEASELRYRLAMQAAQEAVWEWNILTGEVIANELWFSHFGYEPGDVSSNFELWERTLHPEDREASIRALHDYLEGRSEKYDNEHRIVIKSGEVRWHRGTGIVVDRDASGKPVRMIGTNMDITDRKRAEGALERSELRHRLAMRAAQESLWEWNLETGLGTADDLWFELLGYEPGEIPLTYEGWESVVHPEDRMFTQNSIQDYLEGRADEFVCEHRVIVKSGETRWHRSTGMIVEWDDSGKPIRLIGTAMDITDRKSSEAALERSELRHRLAMKAAQAAIWEWELESGEQSVDDLWFEQYGYVRGEIPATYESWISMVHPEDRAHSNRVLEDYLAGRTDAYLNEFRAFVKSGEMRWFSGTGRIAERDADGNPKRLIGTNMDVTEQKRVEARLRATLERLKMATEAAHIGIWSWNFADETIEWDARMFEIYGLDPNGFPNGIRYHVWFDALHPDDRQKAVDELLLSKLHNRPIYREFRIVRPDGLVRHVQAASMVDYGTDGKPLRMIGINRDITEQRDLETSLRDAKVAAEAANLAKSRFLAHMSHEVRTPLTAVLGYADMLSDSEIPETDAADAVSAIRRNGEHLLTILDDVLDLSKIEAGRMLIESIPASPWQVAFDAVTILRIRAADKQVELRSAPATDLPQSCLLDPTRLRQVLVNLLSNSVKFTPPGGSIELKVRCDSNSITFEVSDTGIGMSPDQIAHIFEPFRQADATTTRRFGGTGLGLTISVKLVELMQGNMVVHSEPGKGSLFIVRLPLVWPRTEPDHVFETPQALVDQTTRKHKSKSSIVAPRFLGRILLADDSEDNRRVILHLLKRHGLSADVAVNGLEAVEAARRFDFDLILMDMQMPEMDGFEATRYIRNTGQRLPIIALTASTMTQDRIKAFEAGCTEYLSKPVEPKAFQETLARFLDQAPPA